MAYVRLSDKKVIGTNLASVIDANLNLLYHNQYQRFLSDEAKFNSLVLEDNLNLDDQLKYRQDQLKRVPAGQREERNRVKKEISSLKDIIEQKKFTDSYLDQLTSLNSGLSSYNNVIRWMNDRLSKTTDINIKSKIKEELNILNQKKFESQQNMISNQTTYAANSKSEKIINDQIDRISNERKTVLISGNEEYSSMLDLQMQALEKALAETKITNIMTQLTVSSASGQSAVALLDEFNKLSSNSGNTPITIDGVRYETERDFWESQRSNYLNDRSDNGFFSAHTNEINEKMGYKSSKGLLENDSLEKVSKWFDDLKSRPEMADYMERIDQSRQSSLQTTADLRTNQILNEYSVKGDMNRALSQLSYIQDKYGVDQSLNYQKIMANASAEKTNQVNQITQTMQQIMQDNPGISETDALNQAISSGAGAYFSPEEMATTSAKDLITSSGEKSEQQQFGEESNITAQPWATSSFQTPDFREGGLYKGSDQSTVYKYEAGKLRPFVGNWDQASFKQATGKDFNAVQTVNSIKNVPMGQSILKSQAVDATTSPSAPVTQPSVTTPTQPRFTTGSQGYSSIVDYLQSVGYDTSFQSRRKLFKEEGLGEESDYSGTADQNISLLNKFKY